MRCPECEAQLDADGACPSCGHLIISVEEDDRSSGPPAPPGPEQHKSARQGNEKHPGTGDSLNLAGSWDFSVWLLAITIYSVLLHPTLLYILLIHRGPTRLAVLMAAVGYIPVAYLITRLLCATDQDTGRLKIRNRFLRNIFKKLNSLTFRLS